MTTGPSGAFGSEPNDQNTVQQVTGDTREKAQELAGQAQAQAQQVAGDARNRLREQLDQRSSQAAEQITTQASDLRSVSDTLREQGKDGPANAAAKLAEYAERAGGYLRERDSNALLADAEDLGRRQPWAVAAGGLVLGFAAARFLKASSSRRYALRPVSSGNGSWPADERSPAPRGAPSPGGAPGTAPTTPASPSELPTAPVPRTPGASPSRAAPVGQPQPPAVPTPVRTSGL